MSRQGLALIAFAFGVFMAPLGWLLMETSVKTVAAQDEDLIVIEPVDEDQERGRFTGEEPNLDLIVVEPAPNDPQSVYLDLARQKAQLLTPEALERETQLLRKELVELQATQKLKDAEAQLQRVIEEHPNTTAAERARRMLQSMGPPLVPIPDDPFGKNEYRRPQLAPSTFDYVDPIEDSVPARRAPKTQDLPQKRGT